MDENELQWLLVMAERQFKKIKVSKDVSDKVKAFHNLDNLLETYISALTAN